MWKRFRRWLLVRRIVLLSLELSRTRNEMYEAIGAGDTFTEHAHALGIYLGELESKRNALQRERELLNH